MVKKWKVIFEGESPGAADDFTLEFVDIRDIMGKTLGLKREAIEIINDKIKNLDNYHAIGNIKEIVGPEGEDIIEEACIALLAIDQKDLRFGFLFAFIDNEITLLALWPEGYANAVKEDVKLLSGVIYYMVEKPENWKRVDLILPIQK
ncbi:MAG: hypothetical protein ACP6IQ_07775 [Candidatus Njordarchaeia archaeon]|nr:hypothetical protein [Candidatus Korarchaeota archaeon]RLC66351.1 MAG: hypothetical protein DRI52_12130 [Chloroflexota bacterium]